MPGCMHFLNPEIAQASPELTMFVRPELISDPDTVPPSHRPTPSPPCRWCSMWAVALAYCPCSLPDLGPRRL